MDHYYYLLALLLATAGLFFADYRFRLVFFNGAPRTAAYLLGGCLAFFLVWDITGLALEVFATNPRWVTGLYIVTPNLPIEEFIFLLFLGYSTLITWRLVCLRTS